MVNYNPSLLASGVQWPASRRRSMPLGNTSARCAAVTVGTTQTMDRAKLFLQSRAGQLTDFTRARYFMDVYDASNLDPGPIKSAFVVPVSDQTTSTPFVRSDNGTAVNRFQMVDEGPQLFTTPAPGALDALVGAAPSAGGSSAAVRFRSGTSFISLDDSVPPGSVVSLTGKRIIDVKVCGWMAATNTTNGPLTVQGLLFDGVKEIPLNEAATGQVFALPGDQIYGVCFSSFGTRGPLGFYEPWRVSDLTAFSSAGTGSFGLSIGNLAPGNPNFYLYEFHLQVDYVDDKRIAVSTATQTVDPSPDGGGWVEFDLQNPATFAPATFVKNAGTQFLFALRTSLVTLGGNAWVGLDTASTVDHQDDVLSDLLGCNMSFVDPSHIAAAALPVPTDDFDIVFDSTAQSYYLMQGAIVRTDSQPYAQLFPSDIGGPSGGTIETEFSNSQAAQYGIVTLLMQNTADVHDTDQALTLSIGRRSDNVILASGSLGADALPAVPDDRWYVVNCRLTTSTALTNGVQYFIRIESGATVGHYTIQVLSAEANEAAAQSFGGTTDAATIVGFAEIPSWDAIASAAQIPPLPTGLASTVSTQDSNRLMQGQDFGYECIVRTVSYGLLTWNPTTLAAADFGRYEVERNDDGTWRPIGYIADPAQSVFSDFESRRNATAQWRVRQVRSDGVWSDWAPFSSLVVPASDYEVILASNAAPLKTLGFHEEPGVHYERLSNNRVVTRALYGRDKMLAFRESEDRGDSFTRRLIFAFNDISVAVFPFLGGRAIYDPLVDLIEDATLPHVAFLDYRGRRWYTAPSIEDLGHEEPKGRYVAEVSFIEVAGPTPIAISFGSAPTPEDPVGFYAGGYSEDY